MKNGVMINPTSSSAQQVSGAFAIRPATPTDISALCELDHVAQKDSRRRAFIERAVQAGNCYVVETGHLIVGYGVLEYTFYEQGFVSMLHIHPEYRRQGAGTMLMRHMESICQTSKLFTSTNLSNLPIQALLAKLGYELSGVLHHLDRGDPELVYVKFLKMDAG
ncbi:MAG: N-acetyltransferase [Candidatus Acetothermia bacterium]|nr:N-acetyltransferase [Candidatus Acetothermia bacterium]